MPTLTPDPAGAQRTDWRDTLRDGTDLALVGILVTMAAVPVLTTGAALATAAEAIGLRFTEGHWPGPADLARTLRRRLLPGAVATLAVLAPALLIGANLLLLRAGTVPGGTGATALTAAVALALAGLLALAVSLLGTGAGFGRALRSAAHLATDRPGRLAAACGILALAALLGAIIPVTIPLLVGYVLFALHTITRH